jgi:hypothetical protein
MPVGQALMIVHGAPQQPLALFCLRVPIFAMLA